MTKKKIIIILLLFFVLINIGGFLVLSSSKEVKSWLLKNITPLHRAIELTKAFDIFYVPVKKTTDTKTWNLEIEQFALDKLKSTIPKDYLNGGYNDRKIVKANLYIDGEKYKVKVKYRGSTPGHWAWDKKSWLINFDKDKRYKGIDKINLIVPKNVSFIIEDFNKYRAEKLGLSVPYRDFVNLTINGQHQAFYYLTEKWSPEFLARNNKPDSSNLYGDDKAGYLYDDTDKWNKSSGPSEGPNSNREDLNELFYHFQNRNMEEFESLIDVDNFALWNVHYTLASSKHQSNGENNTLLFNNSSGKFEFIPDDVMIFKFFDNPNGLGNDLSKFALANQNILDRRNEFLKDYLNEDNLKDDLAYYDSVYDKYKYDIYNDNYKRYGNVISDIEYRRYRKLIIENFNHLKEMIDDKESALYAAPKIAETKKDLKKIELDGEVFKYLNNIFDIKLLENKDLVIDENDKTIKYTKGTYFVDEDLIIPKGYTFIIEPGVDLKIASGTSIVSYSPVRAIGTQDERIKISPQIDSHWGSFAVLGAKEESVFEFCDFTNGGHTYINGIIISGMLALHYSPSIIRQSKFTGANGDDALNIKGAKSIIKNNIFTNNDFDAIDLDWASKTLVEDNLFRDNGNDSIDIGGGEGIRVEKNKISNSGDKCISVGEKAGELVVFNNLLLACNIGIASKDGSDPIIINNTIINNSVGIAIYEKKPMFGPASARVINSIVWQEDGKSVFLDDRSSVKISNSDIKGGYDGDDNIDISPDLDDDFVIKNSQTAVSKTGGTDELEKIGLKMKNVPMGIIDN